MRIYYESCVCGRIARQRLPKHVSELYTVKENRRPLLDNGFSYHYNAGVSGTTQTWNTVVEGALGVGVF
jgi:hypothetical protein